MLRPGSHRGTRSSWYLQAKVVHMGDCFMTISSRTSTTARAATTTATSVDRGPRC